MQSSSNIISLTKAQSEALLAIVPAIKSLEQIIKSNIVSINRKNNYFKNLVDNNRSEIDELCKLPELANYHPRIKRLITTFLFFKNNAPDPFNLTVNEIQYVKNLIGKDRYINICYESAAVRDVINDLSFDDLKSISSMLLLGVSPSDCKDVAFECYQVLATYLDWLENTNIECHISSDSSFSPKKLLNGKIHPDWQLINAALSAWGIGELFNKNLRPVLWKEENKQYSLIRFIKVIDPYVVKTEKLRTNSKWEYAFGKIYFRLPEDGKLDGGIPNFYDTTRGKIDGNQKFMQQLKRLHDSLQEKIEWKL